MAIWHHVLEEEVEVEVQEEKKEEEETEEEVEVEKEEEEKKEEMWHGTLVYVSLFVCGWCQFRMRSRLLLHFGCLPLWNHRVMIRKIQVCR